MEVSRSRKGKADVAGKCSSAFWLFRAFKLCYNKNGNSRKKKMRPVGFMMRRYRNYEKIFNGNKAELASAPQSALAPQCLCGFSRLVLQDFRPVRGLIQAGRPSGRPRGLNLQSFSPLGTVDGKKGCYTVIIHCVTALFGYVSIESILERLHVF